MHLQAPVYSWWMQMSSHGGRLTCDGRAWVPRTLSFLLVLVWATLRSGFFVWLVVPLTCKCSTPSTPICGLTDCKDFRIMESNNMQQYPRRNAWFPSRNTRKTEREREYTLFSLHTHAYTTATERYAQVHDHVGRVCIGSWPLPTQARWRVPKGRLKILQQLCCWF